MANFDRVEVWYDTKKYYQDSPEPTIKSVKYNKLDIKPIRQYPTTRIEVVNADMIDVALREKYEYGNNPLLLNMADIYKPGGRVEFGSGAQEECLFRRSNYYRHLTEEFYPLVGADIVYSKNVEFIKANEREGNCRVDPRYLDLMAIPALRFPPVDRAFQNYTTKSARQEMYHKIEMMFKLGQLMKHNVLVLSAFGCGAYGNPPKEVAHLFRNVLKKWNGSFQKVIFAIIGFDNNFIHFRELASSY